MKKTRTHYSNDFKLKAIELSKERGNVDQVAKELNIKLWLLTIRLAMLYVYSLSITIFLLNTPTSVLIFKK